MGKGTSLADFAGTGVKAMDWSALLTLKLTFTGEAALNDWLPTWLACTVTFPAPVNVSTLLLVNAEGPDTTLNVTGSPELAAATSGTGASPKVWSAIAGNVIVWF